MTTARAKSGPWVRGAGSLAFDGGWTTKLSSRSAPKGPSSKRLLAGELRQWLARGSPWIRGFASGIMTTVGGVGHTLPYLLGDFWLATWLAIAVVAIELWAISYIRYKYMDTPFLSAAFQIIVGGLLVFGAGILIGNA